MKLNQFKPWQMLALISEAIITCVMALASISYNATLGTDEPALLCCLLAIGRYFHLWHWPLIWA